MTDSPIDRAAKHLTQLVDVYGQLIAHAKHPYPYYSYGGIPGVNGPVHTGYLVDQAQFYLNCLKGELESANQELAFLENEVEQLSQGPAAATTVDGAGAALFDACVNLLAALPAGADGHHLDTPDFEVTVKIKKPAPSAPVFYVDGVTPGFNSDGSLNYLSVTPEWLAKAKITKNVVAKDELKQDLGSQPQLPKTEYTFGTPVAPTAYLPMAVEPAELKPWDLSTPAKLIYPTYTPAKQGGKTKAATEITQKMLEAALHDLYTPGWQKPDYVHDVVTKASDYGLTSTTLTLSGNSIGAVNYNDVIDFDGKQYLVKNVQTQDYGGFTTMTLTLDHLTNVIEKAKAPLDEFAKSLQKMAKQKPWYAKYNQPPKGKK